MKFLLHTALDYFAIIFILLCCFDLSGQQFKENSFYFFSNIQDNISQELLLKFANEVKNDTGDKHLISMGDNTVENLMQLKNACPDCQSLFLTGESDIDNDLFWDYVNRKHTYKSLLKRSSCPDPNVIKINKSNVLIAINSNWFLDDQVRLDANSDNCITFDEVDFYESLESLIEDFTSDKVQVFLVVHHNTLSQTQRNGHALGLFHLIPFIGTTYVSYIKNNGRPQDLTSAKYSEFVYHINTILRKFDGVYIISGHDHINHFLIDENVKSFNVHSGSKSDNVAKNEKTKFIYDATSYLRLSVSEESVKVNFSAQKDSIVYLHDQRDIGNKNPNSEAESISIRYHDTKDTLVAASLKFKANYFKRLMMGDGYRDEWSQPVKADYFNIDTIHRGLFAYKLGGGGQTESIKFKSGDHRKFVFRLLDKKPEKSLTDFLTKTVYKDIVNDLITTMHPYAPLIASNLMDHTDILHIAPTLGVIPDNFLLESGFEYFEGKLGTLEEKPINKSAHNSGFANADKIEKTFEMIRHLHTSSKYALDQASYVKARIMDIWLGDWDRHEDNWLWARYDSSDMHFYKPIPKDRDHVFSKWSGIIPSIADFVVPNAEDFDFKFNDMRDLNFKARYLDRQLTVSLTKDDWIQAAQYLMEVMTDSIIEHSVQQIPDEIYIYSGLAIEEKLKSRKNDIIRAVEQYYLSISKEVQIAGTNMKDYFHILMHKDGSVTIDIYDNNDKVNDISPYFSRTFLPEETKIIYCFGLGEVDSFDILGIHDQTIEIRIIGGSGIDIITDNSLVSDHNGFIEIFDSHAEDILFLSPNAVIKAPKREARYEPYSFNYNVLIPTFGLRSSSGNGFGFKLGAIYTTQGFNKPEFAKKVSFSGLYYPEIKAYRLEGKFQSRHFIGYSDLNSIVQFSSKNDHYPFFYGIGNSSIFDRTFRDAGLFSLDYQYFSVEQNLETTIFRKSKWSNGILFQSHDVQASNTENILADILSLEDLGFQKFVGLRSHLEIDFTDSKNYPTDGNKVEIKLDSRYSNRKRFSANLYAESSYYKTLNLGFQTTFAIRGLYQQAFGDVNFYHLAAIGSHTTFRGYSRNRFVDRHAFMYNTEIKFKIPTFYTFLSPITSGFLVFYDGGKVWNKSFEFNDVNWNEGYGIGFFISPGIEQFVLTATFAQSDDAFLYTKISLGFDF